MGCFTPDAPAPQNYSAQASSTLQSQMNLMPAELAAQQEFGPLFQAQNFSNLEDELMGTPGGTRDYQYENTAQYSGWYDNAGNLVSRAGQGADVSGATWRQKGTMFQGDRNITSPATRGLLDLYEKEISPAMSRIQSQNRSADIADVARLGPDAMKAIRGYDPGVTGLLDTMTSQAQQRLDLNGALDPFTKRALQQDVRTSQAARGMGTGVNDAAAEAYYTDATRNQRQQQNMATASQVASQVGGYYGDPFMQVLGRAGAGAGNPAATVGQAQGMLPGMMFNPESPYAGNLYNSNQQYAAMFARPSLLNQINQVIGTVGNAASTVGSIAGMAAAL